MGEGRYLLGLLHEENPVGPGIQVEPDQAVYVDEQVIFYNRGVGEAHGERVHSLVKVAFHQQQRVLPKQVGYGARVAALEHLPFVLQDEPVRLWVGREHRGLAEHVGGEDGPEPSHPLVDKRLRVLRLVGRDQLQRLAYDWQTQVPRRQPQPPVPGSSQEVEGRDGAHTQTQKKKKD